jgi:hypothetical protein
VHQVSRRAGLVLAHQAGTVDFHRAMADPQRLADFNEVFPCVFVRPLGNLSRIDEFDFADVFIQAMDQAFQADGLGQKERAAAEQTADVEELMLIPPETVEIVTIRFGSLLEHPQRKTDSAALRFARDLVKDHGWDENDLERVTLIWMPTDPSGPRQPYPSSPASFRLRRCSRASAMPACC